MPKFTRRTVILGALESTPGVDPGSGYTALLANEGAEIKPDASFIERKTIRSNFSPIGGVVSQKKWTLSIPVELKGGGVNAGAIVAPELDWGLQCCAMQKEAGRVIVIDGITGTFQMGESVSNASSAEVGTVIDFVSSGANAGTLVLRDDKGLTLADNDSLTGDISGATANVNVTADTAWVYRPISDRALQKTATVHWSLDGIKHVTTYVRGDLSIDAGVDNYAVCTLDLQGIYSEPTDAANPAASYSTTKPAAVVNAGLAIGDWDMSTTAATKLQVALKNTVVARNDINAADGITGIEVTGRGTNGSIDPEVASISAHNPWSLWKNGTTQKIYATIGCAAGERIRLLMPMSQYQNFNYQDRDGISAYQLPFMCNGGNEGAAGDDEFYMIFY